MASELKPFTDTKKAAAEIIKLRGERPPLAIVCSFPGHLLHFAGIAFPGKETREIFAKKSARQPEGKGAHFDMYGNLVDEEFPWLGVYNLAGHTNLTVAKLPDDLAANYNGTFPDLTEEAHVARRHYSAIALAAPGVETHVGAFNPNMGVLLPQRPRGPHVIHDIVPVSAHDAGAYIKLVAPATNRSADILHADGYETLDVLVTKSLGRSAARSVPMPLVAARVSVPLDRPSRRRAGRRREGGGGSGLID